MKEKEAKITRSSIRRDAHCRSCGGHYDLYLLINDICTPCIHKAAARMQEMNKENAKAENARICVPLLPYAVR